MTGQGALYTDADASPPCTGASVPGRVRLFRRGFIVLVTVSLYAAIALPAFSVRYAVSGGRAARDGFWHDIVRLLERLGPTFVKCGQILSTRRDELPNDLCDALQSLQDRCRPISPRLADAAFRAAFGGRLSAYFETIEPEPVACGSIAAVYRARTNTGREVALKLRRPGIARVMEADLAIARAASALLARLRVLRDMPVMEVVENMCTAIELQLDFSREADCLEKIREVVASVPRVWVPETVRGLCRPEVLAMEFIPGLDGRAAEKMTPSARRRMAHKTLSSLYTMLFIDGFVHCDMHAGNLYFRNTGHVVLLDAGFSVQMSERMRRLFAEFFLEMAWGRSRRCAEIVLDSAQKRPDQDPAEPFLADMADLAHRNHRLPAREFSLIAFASEMFALHRKHGLRAAPELVFPLLALLVVEGMVRRLDPEIDFQETAKPILTQAIFAGSPRAIGSGRS